MDLTRRIGKNVSGFSNSALKILKSYYWPGNVRELRNCIEKAIIMSDSNIINASDLQFIVNTKKEREQYDEIIPL
jgi:transcriptional regulator with PAS, ATPase and Fis domain